MTQQEEIDHINRIIGLSLKPNFMMDEARPNAEYFGVGKEDEISLFNADMAPKDSQALTGISCLRRIPRKVDNSNPLAPTSISSCRSSSCVDASDIGCVLAGGQVVSANHLRNHKVLLFPNGLYQIVRDTPSPCLYESSSTKNQVNRISSPTKGESMTSAVSTPSQADAGPSASINATSESSSSSSATTTTTTTTTATAATNSLVSHFHAHKQAQARSSSPPADESTQPPATIDSSVSFAASLLASLSSYPVSAQSLDAHISPSGSVVKQPHAVATKANAKQRSNTVVASKVRRLRKEDTVSTQSAQMTMPYVEKMSHGNAVEKPLTRLPLLMNVHGHHNSSSTNGIHSTSSPTPNPNSNGNVDDASSLNTSQPLSNAVSPSTRVEVKEVSRLSNQCSCGGVNNSCVCLKSQYTGSPKVFACSYVGCHYSTIRHSDLKVHIRTHTGEKPYKCTYEGCVYAAITKSILVIHMRIHTGEKPQKCTFLGCTYSTANHSNLKVHMRTHTGEKPFKCSFDNCKYASITSSDLKKHMRTHLHEKPYHCPQNDCQYSCITRADLKKHVKKHNDAQWDTSNCELSVPSKFAFNGSGTQQSSSRLFGQPSDCVSQNVHTQRHAKQHYPPV